MFKALKLSNLANEFWGEKMAKSAEFFRWLLRHLKNLNKSENSCSLKVPDVGIQKNRKMAKSVES